MNHAALLHNDSRRAAEDERIEHKAERQTDLAWLRERLRSLLPGRRVREVACGTGCWTAAIADGVARHRRIEGLQARRRTMIFPAR